MAAEPGYFTILLPDIALGRKFYGELFGWTFELSSATCSHVNNTKLPLGLNTGGAKDFWSPYFGVEAIAAACEKVSAPSGAPGEICTFDSGLSTVCADDQRTKFRFWQSAA